MECNFQSAVTPKDCFVILEASLSKFIDDISIFDCKRRASRPRHRYPTNDGAVTFLWPAGPENVNGRIEHAG